MAQVTPKLNLRKPQSTDRFNYVTDINNNLINIDNSINFGYGEDSSFNRVGQIYVTSAGHIKEANTKTVIGKLGQPKGLKAIAEVTSSSPNITAGNELMTSLKATANLESGRRYMVETQFCVQTTSYANGHMPIDGRIRWALGSDVTVAGVVLGGKFSANSRHTAGNTTTCFKFLEIIAGSSGNHTFGLSLTAIGSQTVNMFANTTGKVARIMVRDYAQG